MRTSVPPWQKENAKEKGERRRAGKKGERF